MVEDGTGNDETGAGKAESDGRGVMVEAGTGTIEPRAGMSETDACKGGRWPGSPCPESLVSRDALLGLSRGGALTEEDCGLFNHCLICDVPGGTPGEATRTCEPKGPKGVLGASVEAARTCAP